MYRLARKALVAAAAWLALQPFAFAEDVLELAVGQRGSWETGIFELDQIVGIFKKHGLAPLSKDQLSELFPIPFK
ncbi:MAG: hypothetical protein ACREUE_17765 [Panacagrimonas sp.]